MSRMVADCREFPSEIDCTLTISGEEDEVLDVAVAHAIAAHQHEPSPELREMIRSSLKPEQVAMSFIQMIEVETSRYTDLEALHQEWLAETEGERTVVSERICEDRDNPGTYVMIVEFPSEEAAAVNNALPATERIAAGMAELASSPPSFRNLNLLQAD